MVTVQVTQGSELGGTIHVIAASHLPVSLYRISSTILSERAWESGEEVKKIFRNHLARIIWSTRYNVKNR